MHTFVGQLADHFIYMENSVILPLQSKLVPRSTESEGLMDDQSDENDKEGESGRTREIIKTVSNLVARRLISFWEPGREGPKLV